MKIYKRISLIACGLVMTGAAATAQSPYSKFGYGLLNDNASAAQRQMGGVGYAMRSGRQINVMNPASYASSDTLTFLFDMGVDFTMVNSKDVSNGATLHQNGGGLDYVTMQVPIGRFMGASLGLLPFSSVGYSFGSEITNGTNSHEGSGGINQLYLGFAARPVSTLSVGFNFSYLFGSVINDVYVTGTSTSLFEQHMRVRDWRFQLGAQYTFDINKDNKLTAGLVYTPKKSLLGRSQVIKYDVTAEDEPDTISSVNLKHNAALPASWGAGLSYGWQNRLNVEADFTYQQWSKVKVVQQPGFSGNRFADRWQVGFGADFRPSVRGSYLSRITYRAGGFFSRDYMMVGDNHVREYGVSVGFGLPALSSKTLINVGFEYRHRQADPNPLLKESYFNIRLGINFNELWFFQNKIK